MFLHFPYHHYQADAQHTSITFHVWFAHVAVVFRPNFINNYCVQQKQLHTRVSESGLQNCVIYSYRTRFHKKTLIAENRIRAEAIKILNGHVKCYRGCKEEEGRCSKRRKENSIETMKNDTST